MRALAVVAVALLAACGASTGSQAVGTAALDVASPGATGPDVVRVAAHGHVCLDRATSDAAAAGPSAGPRPAVPAGAPGILVRCRVDVESVRGDGQWQVRLEETAVSGVGALVAAVRLPDLPRTDGACPAIGQVAPDVWAVDAAGRAVRFRWPVDGCGLIRTEAMTALEAVRWRTAAFKRLQQVASQAALDSGCEMQWKEMAAIEATSGIRHAAGDLSGLSALSAGKVCVYRITDRQTPGGTFAAGSRLTGPAWRRLASDLAVAPADDAASTCSTVGSRFAVVEPGTAQEAYVELDGCRRILAPQGGFRASTDAVVADLRAVRS
jgi:hypothetical protein